MSKLSSPFRREIVLVVFCYVLKCFLLYMFALGVVGVGALLEVEDSIDEELADVVVGAAGDVLNAGSYLVWLQAQSKSCVISALWHVNCIIAYE